MTIEKSSKAEQPTSAPTTTPRRGGKREGAGRPTNVQIGLRKLATAPRTLLPVELQPSASAARVAITSPNGFRIEGLTFEQACLLLRVLA